MHKWLETSDLSNIGLPCAEAGEDSPRGGGVTRISAGNQKTAAPSGTAVSRFEILA
jgi:hypothetical protein